MTASVFSSTIPKEPTADQLSLMKVVWTENLITAPSTTGTIGLFGSKIDGVDRYFFYLKFTPNINIATSSATGKFRLWFEMGAKGKSEWHGVYYDKTVASTFTAQGLTEVNLKPCSATATSFNANTAADFDLSYSTFKGIMKATGEVIIWRETL